MITKAEIETLRNRADYDELCQDDIQCVFQAVEERDALLHKIVVEAGNAEDGGDFILWVQDELADWLK